ncbi:MAG: triple tyrosine motif-containing protein [Candidatus Thermoplasmatota archaeon]|nr:triple tyrosine motif-containing protein [Candidatus Thermoplasmatota archaeon]
MKKMQKSIFSLIVAILLFVGGFTGAILEVSGSSDTQIGVSPYSQTVSPDETFTVNITIDPAEPIIGAQCSISFNPSVLEVVDMVKGDLFEGFNEFFIDGIVDNINGTIKAIANMIFGLGNVSTAGTFATITFRAKSAGTSPVDFIMGTAENPSTLVIGTEYQTIIPSPNNGTVTVTADNTPPTTTITSGPSGTINYNDVTFEWTGSDDITSTANLVYSYKLEGYDGSWSAWVSDTSRTYNDLPNGGYTFKVKARDEAGNEDQTPAQRSFTVETGEDTIPPEISDILVTPPVQEAGKTVKISATVIDNVALADVFLDIEYPDASHYNFSIKQNVTGHTYYCEKSYTQLGTYNFTIYAVDDASNGNASAIHSFQIQDTTPPEISGITANPFQASPGHRINVSATVTDNVGIADVFLNISYPDASHYNFSIKQNVTGHTYYCEKSYTQLGTYNFTIYAIDDASNGNASAIHSFHIKDTTPPVVEALYPNGKENVSGVVTIKWNATDNHDPANLLKATIKYSVDGGVSWQTMVANAENTGEYQWNTADLEDGHNYLIKISVKDSSNNQGTDTSNSTFTLDNTPPSLSLQKPRRNHLYLFDREVMPILRPKAIVIGKITVTANVSDATSGVNKVEFFVDNVSKNIDSEAPYEWEWDETVFCSHTLKVTAYDNAGNSASSEVDVKVYNI